MIKGKKLQFEETERESGQDSDIAGMLELLNWEFKTTMINTLRALLDKADTCKNRWAM